MQPADRTTAIFWFTFGLLITAESYRLNLGSLRRPDSGLYPFLIGVLLVLLSCLLLGRTFFGKAAESEREQPVERRSIISCLLALYAYALVLDGLGFLLSTFVLIFFLLKIVVQRGWVLAAAAALLTSLASYVIFNTFLHAALPRGIFGF